jgi:hypothetical protein
VGTIGLVTMTKVKLVFKKCLKLTSKESSNNGIAKYGHTCDKQNLRYLIDNLVLVGSAKRDI